MRNIHDATFLRTFFSEELSSNKKFAEFSIFDHGITNRMPQGISGLQPIPRDPNVKIIFAMLDKTCIVILQTTVKENPLSHSFNMAAIT